MCEANSMIRGPFRGSGRVQNLNISQVIPDALMPEHYSVWYSRVRRANQILLLESLILAQDERWRRA